MSELGVIADLLEDESEPGLAAAIRVLEYCEVQFIGVTSCNYCEDDEVAMWPLIGRAVQRLADLGRPDISSMLEDIYIDIRDYGRILPPRTPGLVLLYAPPDNGMREFRRGDDPRDLYIREPIP